MPQKWIKAEEAADMPAGGKKEGGVIIRPVTRHNGKEPAICQLRPAPKDVTCISHIPSGPVGFADEYSHTDTLTSSA